MPMWPANFWRSSLHQDQKDKIVIEISLWWVPVVLATLLIMMLVLR